ncbi:alpha-ketoglutarate dehydrogenase component 4-like [Procambarus clarkii]|uniref:alpha-ketoglutarate dehydrogenase component 4 n=1 Tax=Procambarus clarkii TaxID=6728 RepID=UPI001E676130|nr:28S ribosomal protein S36, mitochondrial-like [Procambarus clarkii]
MQVTVFMTALAGTIHKAVRPHIPLIKFRKGGLTELVRGAPQPIAAAGPVITGSSASPTPPPPVLEEWQVPPRYRRERITEEEIEYINRGGPA